jgi:hypothetical protein
MNERLKRIIFKKLDQDLGHAEIIVDDDKSIWFIDRANKFWYLELRTSGTLWWRYSFFRDFFPLFGLERLEYEPVIAEWVEEVLKRGVSSTGRVPVWDWWRRWKRFSNAGCPQLGTEKIGFSVRWKRSSIINYNLYERKIKTNYIQKVRPRFGSC